MSRSLVAMIRQRQRAGLLPVLSEIKVRSPKEGDLLGQRDPVALAQQMAAGGIVGLSVVTESVYFGGNLDLIRRVRPHLALPILCKDFIRLPVDLEGPALAGADAILLIVTLLTDKLLLDLHMAAQALGLETLVETHSVAEVERVVALGLQPDLLGINNRDIRVHETDDGDVSLTERVAGAAPPGSLLLSESAIRHAADAKRARDAGADAVLVGTAILRADDPTQAIRDLVAVGWRP